MRRQRWSWTPAAIIVGFALLWGGAPLFAQAVTRRLPPVEQEPSASETAAISEAAAVAATVEPERSGDGRIDAEGEPPPDAPHWYEPSYWTLSGAWERSFQVGISGSSGNAETLSFQLGTDWKRKVDWSQLDVSLIYNKAENAGVETKNNGLLNVDHQWLFEESRWAIFLKNALEYDEFKAFDLRLAVNAGATYHVLEGDDLKLDLRLGSGASTEFGGPDNRWVPEAVLGGDYEHQWTAQQKFKLTWDYFPDWTDFGDYRVVSKASWELMLDEPRNLSFKISLIERYDSTPHDRVANDIDYAFVLMWKR